MIMEPLLAVLAAIAFFVGFTIRFKRGVLRMVRVRGGSTMLTDNGPGAWTIEWASLWVGRLSNDWRERYGNTWACGDEANIWYYTPKETVHGSGE